MKNNILAELQRMGVSIIHGSKGIALRGERSSEAISRFKPYKQALVAEVGKYHEAKAKGASQKTIDMARAIASAWDWSEGDWELYWHNQRKFDADEEVKLLFAAEIETSPWRYECAGVT